MKKEREFARIIVSKKGENWLDTGHPWCYGSDVTGCFGSYENGDLVDVVGPKNKYLGTGFVNDNSKIRVRIISRDASVTFNEDFWYRRVKNAWDYRKTVVADSLDACRLIHGEADYFPGVTVDKFNDILVTQIQTMGMERNKDVLYRNLFKVLKEDGYTIRGIYERNTAETRKKEGLDLYEDWYKCEWLEPINDTGTVILENDLKICVDFVNGQKTGYFLDQRTNRKNVGKLANNKKVLDCFTHTGSFALNCALNGAKEVTAVDISELALEQARKNAEINGLEDKITFVCADVFEYLDTVNKKDYDLIILDPPAFTKSRSTVAHAYNGYLDINLKAMKLLGKGGYLATCSCSHFMPHELFEKMLKEAAFKANVQLKQVSVSQQDKDHPILWNVPETDYLKFYIFQIN